jgi:flagellar motor switch protein FliG
MLSPSLRKAAVLISALDEPTADAILQQMSPDDAAKVRSALIELDEIPADEQQRALADFFRQQGARAMTATNSSDDVSLEMNPQFEAVAYAPPSPALPVVSHEESSFDFLQHVDFKALAALLRGEHPQTVAVVISQLNAERAAIVLQELPAALATDALERIAWLDELSNEVQADLVRALRQQLAPHIKTAQAGPESLAHVSAVLSAMDYRQRERVVLQLAQRNTALVERLGLFPNAQARPAQPVEVASLRYRLDSPADLQTGPRTSSQLRSPAPSATSLDDSWLTFTDLMLLNDAALRSIFAAADPDLALLALTGAEPRLIARILRKLPAREAALLRQRLEHPGPLRVRDVEQAQAALAAIASRLAHEGTITLPPAVRFAAAV